MTESVTPPDPPLVDPETGETAPLSPQRFRDALKLDTKKWPVFVEGSWEEGVDDGSWEEGVPSDGA
jgi:hypothetical protein